MWNHFMNSSTADITPPILKKHSGLDRNRPKAIRRRLSRSCPITKAAHILRGFLISFFTFCFRTRFTE